jgi:DNA-binding transcriptional ArsR family regulator
VDLEDVFSSKIRIKILKTIAQVGELNVSEIARRLNINHKTTSEHLKILENEGILQYKKFGRIRLYRLNGVSPKARAVQNLIEVWERLNK